ncbi:MAG: hypothetical protein KF901_23840 [Myxococcales bacterium]|nr:hypothetical protein [Myxococcales bacterium]
MPIFVRVTVDPRALRGTNAAVDVEASLARYVEELRGALARELPDVAHRVEIGQPKGAHVEGLPAGEAEALRALVEGVADAVRQCGAWVVYE